MHGILSSIFKMKNSDIKTLIEEYAAKENEIIGEFIRTLSKKPYESSILDFYPEFKLKRPYTSAWHLDMPVWLLLPYYAKIIVPIYPYDSESGFEKRYGLGIEELLQLEKAEKLALRLYLPSPQAGIPQRLSKNLSIETIIYY
jgi:hypothetical protein